MTLRTTNLDKLATQTFDVLIVGGGINGAVAAASLSARGAKVSLVDRADFAGLTSQESSNLAWGGIKYMESFELGLVRKLCLSRNELMRSYPSTVQEIRFLSAHPRGFRHGLWKLFLGTWLYWLLGSCFTRVPRLLSTARIAREEPVVDVEACDGGFEYSDAYLHDNDARFVWGFIRRALDHGAIAANYVEALGGEPGAEGLWAMRARDRVTGRELTIRARTVVNAAGPLVDALNEKTGETTQHRHALSKGVHLITRRLTPSKRVLTFFADDGRPFFVVPMGPCTAIGTTDTKVDTHEVSVTDEDRRFILDNINKRLALEAPLTEADVVAERCGVRPLAVAADGTSRGDWMQLSRKHVLEVDRERRYVSIFGGKLTDCLNVGDEVTAAVVSLGVSLPYARRRWYGEPAAAVRDEFFHQARLIGLDALTSPSSPEMLSVRLWRRYGGKAFDLLEAVREDPRAAEILIEGAEYVRCEVEQAARREMIVKLDDFLRRRSKIALVLPRSELRDAAGLREACAILFGDEAEAKLAEYFEEGPVVAEAG